MSRNRNRRTPPDPRVEIIRDGDTPWPRKDPMFYRVAAGGLYICRNHRFYKSCVKAPKPPSKLAEQEEIFEPRFPRLSRSQFELAVGFFSEMAERHGAEAAVLLGWDEKRHRVRLVVPEQTAEVSVGSRGHKHALRLQYQVPFVPPEELVLFGDIHSHAYAAAYASATDVHDEMHRAGLHIVVGRLDQEPPDIHIEAVVDGTRFPVDPDQVLGGYRSRSRKVPQEWLDRVKVETFQNNWWSGSWSTGSTPRWNSW